MSTSTAGMVGVTARGPSAGKPQLVTNFLEFQTTFGGFLPLPDQPIVDSWALDETEGGQWWNFALSVKGFFDNGGQRLYVKRVVSSTATPASALPTPALVSDVSRDAAAGATTLAVTSLVGFTGANPTVTVLRGDDGSDILTTTVAAYSLTGPTITLADPLPAQVRSARGDYVRVGAAAPAPPGPGDDTVSFTAVSEGTWGNQTQVRARPVVAATLPLLADPLEGAGFLTRVVADTAADATTVTVAPAVGLDPADLPTDVWVLIAGLRYQVTVGAADGDGNIPLSIVDPVPHGAWPAGTAVRRLRRVNPPQGGSTDPSPTLHVGGAGRLYPGAIVQIDNGTAMTLNRVVSIAGDSVTFAPDAAGTYFENNLLLVVEAQVVVQAAAQATETINNLRLTTDDPTGLVAGLAQRSALIRAATGPGLTSTSDPATYLAALGGRAQLLAGGDDKFQDLSVADFVGVDGGSGARTGIVAMEDIDEIAICAVPGVWSGTVQSALITHCEFLKDRFAALDPRNDLSIEQIQTFREPYDTTYAALYYPWLVTRHPTTNADVEVAPSGHILGIYARTDVERGVHKAPANAVIRGILTQGGIAQDVTKRQQDLLNPKGINALRFFPNQGSRVWGARTLSSDPAWRYINVRRLFLFLEESIDEGTQWVVFEPNGEPLWALVRQTVSNFLTTVWHSGALAGTTPDEAFFVACDRTTMTEDDLQNGRLICVIGVAPVFPAEFVIFRIQQLTQLTQLT
ncbi:MAG: phage tail sheath subtilisin-like domain-containing protein [Micromonosporaceae bacterium]|nr:phage tail sheath subtilisin-like domain-containing protein [Micromonosporaceae bacterium]